MVKDFHLNEIKKEDLQDFKNRERFIGRCKKFLESSYEYKKYQAFLDTSQRGHLPKIEQHFTPFYFSDVIDMVISRKEAENEKITEFSVSKELMGLLYNKSIPHCLIPISLHYAITFEKVEDYIYSKDEFHKFKPFIEKYLPYMPDVYVKKLDICIGKIEGKRTRKEKKDELIKILENKTYNIHSNRDDMEKDAEVLFFLSGKEVNGIYRDLALTDRCPRSIKKDITLCPYYEYNDCLRLCDNIENCWEKYLKDDFNEDVKISEDKR